MYNRVPSTGERLFAVRIYDSCANDQYVATASQKCQNDGQNNRGDQPSYCADVLPGHLVAGFDPSACMAMSSQWVVLNADVSPSSYNAATGAPLTATTSFVDGFDEQLRELSCTDIIGWDVIGWTFRWSDGTTDTLPGNGHNPATDAHVAAPDPTRTGASAAGVIATAHLHIRGQALDFDAAGNLVTVARDAFVDISNRASSGAAGGPPVYTPPQLQLGAIAVGQDGDGSMPAGDLSAPAHQHVRAIRGRLTNVFPRAIVITPGTESIGGVVVGQGTTTTLSWTYTGPITDAPPTQASGPDSTGSPAAAIHVQWNHAERLDARGQPVDEALPITISVRTTYPDGHTEDSTLSQSISVTIHYVGLNYNG